MSNNKALFEDTDDSEEDINVLKVNKSYAEKYDKFRVQEELQKFKGFSDVESDSSSESSEDEECPFKNKQYALDFYLTMGALRSKDPKLQKKRFFKDSYDEPEKKKKETPMRLVDYQREILLQKKGHLLDEDEDETKPAGYLIKDGDEVKKPIPFSFDDGNISEDDGDMFTAVEKSKNDAKSEKYMDDADEALQYLNGDIDSMKNKKHQNILQHVRKDPQANADEKEIWLDNFFIKNALNPDSDCSDDNCIEDNQSLSGEEDTEKKLVEFDRLHRFRYEEDNEEQIKNYPRIIVNTSKIKENKRRKKRLEVKERKKREKADKIREYRTLKALELQNKLKDLRKSAGFDVDVTQNDLDGVFDLDSHSKLMDNLFNENFYDQDDDNEKPEFEDDKEIYGDYDEWIEKNGIYTNDEGGTSSGSHKNKKSQKLEQKKQNNDDLYEPTGGAMDQLMAPSTSGRQKKKSKFAEALLKKKGIFDPEICSFDEYYEKNYGLECEAFIGDMPVKFKYRNVHNNNYGLSTHEILQATDGELNQWLSWKKLARFERSKEEEKTDHVRFKIKAKNVKKMKKILPSLFEDSEKAYAEEEEKKRRKYDKKKGRKLRRKQELKKKRRRGNIEEVDEHKSPPKKKTKIANENNKS